MPGMKARTIKSVITNKFEEFLASIDNGKLRKLVRENTIVTGGCIVSMLLGEKINDFDLYFRTKEVARAVAEYYVARFRPKARRGIECKISVQDFVDWRGEERIRVVVKSAGVASENGNDKPYQYFEGAPSGEAGIYLDEVMSDVVETDDTETSLIPTAISPVKPRPEDLPRYRPIFLSSNAITLSDRVQLIIRFFGDAEEIHENYDFVHCTNYWTSWDGQLFLHPAALQALLARELVYVGSLYPIASILRMRKFIKREWRINAGQVLKMALQIGKLDLTDPEVLADQLTGVDVAYFAEVMAKLRERDPEKIDTAYLVEIIDRMF